MAIINLPDMGRERAVEDALSFVEIRASAVLTAAYVAAASDLNVAGKKKLVIDFDFTIGSLTSVEIKLQYSPDGGTTWIDVRQTGAYTAGVQEPVPDIVTLTATAVGAQVWNVEVFNLIRVLADGTGTVTSSLLALRAAAA